VVDEPQWLQLPGAARLLVPLGSAQALAEVLGLDLSSERPAAPPAGGERLDVPEAALMALAPHPAPRVWQAHESLAVDGIEVEWWVSDGQVQATTLAGLARGLAQAAGQWPRRHLVAAVLAEPDRADELLAEAALDP
jgi:hypothetical protein